MGGVELGLALAVAYPAEAAELLEDLRHEVRRLEATSGMTSTIAAPTVDEAARVIAAAV